MNRILVRVLSLVNVIVAIAIIAFFTVAGGPMLGMPASTSGGATPVGLLLGVIVASVVCGFIALLSLIETHLRQLLASSKRLEKFHTNNS